MTILNAVLVRYAKGYKSATDATSISTYGRKESFLSLSSLEEPDSAQQSGEKTLDLYAELQRTVTIAIEPLTDADCPYKGVFVRDAVTAPSLTQRGAGTGTVPPGRAGQVRADSDWFLKASLCFKL